MGRKALYRLTAIIAVLGLAFAGTASAYKLPKPPGSPGGPPTKPKSTGGGTKTQSPGTKQTVKDTNGGATALGTKLAGLTAAELATQGTFTITVKFPSGGSMLAKVSAGGKTIGQGFAGRATSGSGPLSLTFTSAGEAFLRSHNGQAVKLTIKITFIPNNHKRKIVSSTVTIQTLP